VGPAGVEPATNGLIVRSDGVSEGPEKFRLLHCSTHECLLCGESVSTMIPPRFVQSTLLWPYVWPPTSATFAAATSPLPASGRIAARPLTDAAIRVLRDGESRTDGSLPVGAGRLIIECRKSRSALRRRWVFRYRTASTSRKLLLGDYPGLSRPRSAARGRAGIYVPPRIQSGATAVSHRRVRVRSRSHSQR
jgi:hypothetical protein